ncbi:hypothetical protein AcW1_003093 [Taiwanofungus camphoratus]|nr:hypothetical protein AcW1_003093 [Antrodia cinnamomea]
MDYVIFNMTNQAKEQAQFAFAHYPNENAVHVASIVGTRFRVMKFLRSRTPKFGEFTLMEPNDIPITTSDIYDFLSPIWRTMAHSSSGGGQQRRTQGIGNRRKRKCDESCIPGNDYLYMGINECLHLLSSGREYIEFHTGVGYYTSALLRAEKALRTPLEA